MRMRAESLPSIDAILIDNAQGAKSHVRGVIVTSERKCVMAIEPAVVGVSAILSASKSEHAAAYRGP